MNHKENILKLKSQGKSYRQIQAILGCSKGTISYHLGEGQKQKTRERIRSRRTTIRTYIQEYKQSKPCHDCKENYPYYMMDFDHLGDKDFNISNFQNYTEKIEIIKKEIEKCDVVCANCHRIRTYSRSVKSGESIMDISEFYK